MKRLSLPLSELKPRYSVVVIGSGYGAGVAASRLSRAGQSVCVLERGKEFVDGEFPDTLEESKREVQFDTPTARLGSVKGLYDFRINKDVDVLIGCGLGGTSLINANVSLIPEPRVFASPFWPAGIREHVDTLLAQGFERARAMLQPTPYPGSLPGFPKMPALEVSAKALGRPYEPAPLNVAFEDRVNPAGVPQKACILCGDCVSGCNHGSKNTVHLTYIMDAYNHGAEIFTEITVRSLERRLERRNDHWVVHYQPTGQREERQVFADMVILGAGSLGSTEILLRSAERGLPLSARVGQRFSANGDFLGFAYNNETEIRGVGFGDRLDRQAVGPTISGIIRYPAGQAVDEEFLIEEGAIPGLLAQLLPAGFATAAATVGQNTVSWLSFARRHAQKERIALSLVEGARKGAMNNTQTFLVIGHDNAEGVMRLLDDRVRIHWPGAGKQQIYKKVQSALYKATAAHGGIYVKEPTWTEVLCQHLITVHPLGGCAMAETAEAGVVNHKNQVFKSAQGSDVYEDLYVTCGAAIPTSVGVNPLFTISAVAERAMSLLLADRGLTENIS